MARALRPQLEDALYYITVRGNNRQFIFRDHHDQRHYIELLNRYRERFDCRLYAYILLNNHLHFILETPRANVGKFMQCLGTSYASYFNRRYKRRGTLFEGRYQSHLLSTSQLLDFTQQVHVCSLGGEKEQKGSRLEDSSAVSLSAATRDQLAGADLKKAEDIIHKVSLSLSIAGVGDLREKRRKAMPRHLAMYLIRRQTPLPLRLIGTLLGVKPAAVAIAIGKVEKRLKEGGFPQHIEALLKKSIGSASL